MLEIGEPRQLVVPCVQCGDNKIIMARQVTKEEVERNPAFAEFLQVSRSNSPNDRRASRVSSRSRSSVCRHRGTPGHKCGQRYTFKSSNNNNNNNNFPIKYRKKRQKYDMTFFISLTSTLKNKTINFSFHGKIHYSNYYLLYFFLLFPLL